MNNFNSNIHDKKNKNIKCAIFDKISTRKFCSVINNMLKSAHINFVSLAQSTGH